MCGVYCSRIYALVRQFCFNTTLSAGVVGMQVIMCARVHFQVLFKKGLMPR